MLELFQMWALVEVVGLICLPLTITTFHNLPDRGWAFSKAIAMALLAFSVWLPLMLLRFLPFSQLFIVGVILIIIALNLVGLLRVRHELVKLIRANLPYIVATELVFFGMVFLLGWIRSYGPDIRGFEMYMDEGFIAAIMRSPHLPPSDMWFAGYSINYYYYAQFVIAVLAKLLNQSPSIAFNTGICTYFGLTAVSLFGITCNIVAWARHLRLHATTDVLAIDRPDTAYPSLLEAIPYGMFTFAMGLILGNLAATQEWFKVHGDWTQYDWFWAPTRVVGDGKTINEFPAFSFLLSCFHAHVLTLAFTIVAMGLAFNLFLEPSGKGLFVFGRGWRLVLTIGTTALILGGLFTMNGWDFPTYVGLTLICIALQQWLAYGTRFRFELVLDILTAGGCLTALSFLLYIPFYLNFISPAQGLGIVSPADRSPLSSELLIYGLFAFVFLSLVVASVSKRPLFALFSEAETSSAFQESTAPRRWSRLGFSGIVLFLLLGFAVLVFMQNSTTFVVAASIALVAAVLVFYHLRDRSHAFILLLGAVAFGLVAVCEVFFLKDVFAGDFPRMNTVFKFYFQAWAQLSIACGAGLFFILESFRPEKTSALASCVTQHIVRAFWSVGLLVLLLCGMVYPLVGTYARSNHFLVRTNSLDGLAYLQTDAANPGDYDAIRWLNANVSGNPVIIEAVGPDYSNYARISAFTGLPTLMGWVGHEYQWRVNWLNNGLNNIDFQRRTADVDLIYTNPDASVVLSVMARYHAEYLYVGALEHQKYPATNLQRFSTFMQVAYNANGITIYKVR